MCQPILFKKFKNLCLYKIMNLNFDLKCVIDNRKRKKEIFYQSLSTSIKVERINLLFVTILYEFRNKVIY